MEEREKRFAHLLQPIRDLAKNWDIDIAGQLEEYLSEIDGLSITFDAGLTTTSFTEAALLIQGTACIYSKKVEYLYTLVYQVLNLVSSKQRSGQCSSVDAEGGDRDVSGVARMEEEELLTLDDLPESANIDLDEAASCVKAVGAVPRTPMSLIPYHESEKSGSILYSRTGEVLGNRMDFKMNTCVMHPSGALLLDSAEQLTHRPSTARAGRQTPALATHFSATRKQVATNEGHHEVPAMAGSYLLEDPAGPMDLDDTPCRGYAAASPGGDERSYELRQQRHVPEEPSVTDNWKLLDPHEPKKQDLKPFKKGNTFRIPKASKQSASRKRKSSSESPDFPKQPLSAFIISTYYSNSSLFPQQAHKVPVFPESEIQFWKEMKNRKRREKRRSQKLAEKRKTAVPQAGPVDDEDNEGYEEYGGYGGHDGEDDTAVDHQMEAVFSHLPEGGGGPVPAVLGVSHQGVEPMALNVSMEIDKHPVVQSYEELVHSYVELALKQAQVHAQETELSRRVQEWDDRIRPKLVEEENHPQFDIHHYGQQIVEGLDTGEEDNKLSFRELVQGKEVYNICRIFAATLQLANNYNVEICSTATQTDNDVTSDGMLLKLLSKKLVFEDLQHFRAPSVEEY